MDGSGLPVDVLRLVLQQLLGEERHDAYRLMRDLQNFALVSHTWRDVAFSTPLRINLDYLVDLKWEAVRWLLKATFADLQVHPNFHINRLLTNPDFAARNRWTLQRLWGAQMLGAPGRWPQWRHFPGLETLELSCDSMAAQPQVFESRLLAPLTQLKHLSLQQFAGADLTRLPRSLRTLSADLDAVLPLRLPEGLVLEELNLATSRLLVDWGRLCKQVERLAVIQAACIDMVAGPPPAQGPPLTLFRHAAAGFREGVVQEVELVAQEVALVRVGGQLARHIPEEAYLPDVVETMHLVTLAADLQQHDFRDFGCVYNPDDLQADEELGMRDGMTVHLHRAAPGQPRTLGFSYSLHPDQLAYLVAEAEVAGLALEAVPAEEAAAVLGDEDFRGRCAASLASLQGLDLLPSLELGVFTRLQRLEGYLLHDDDSWQAVGQLPPSLTSLDLCAVAEEEGEPLDPESWPAFVAGPADGAGPSIAHLTSLRELSLRHFREVDLRGHAPPGLETITIECPRPRLGQLGPEGHPAPAAPPCPCPACVGALSEEQLTAARHCERFDVRLPPLPEGGRRSLVIQLHQNHEYPVRRPLLFLDQFMHHATHATISVTADPPPEPHPDQQGAEPDGGGDAGGGMDDGDDPAANFVHAPGAAAFAAAEAAAAAPRIATLVLAAQHGTLREALDALTASPLQAVDVDAPQVLFTDASGERYTSCTAVLDFIRHAYGHAWLAWSHEPPPQEGSEEEEEEEAGVGPRHGGGFTMRRK